MTYRSFEKTKWNSTGRYRHSHGTVSAGVYRCSHDVSAMTANLSQPVSEEEEEENAGSQAAEKGVEVTSHTFSRWRQRQNIKKEYRTGRTGREAEETASAVSRGIQKAVQTAKQTGVRLVEFVSTHGELLLILCVFGLLIAAMAGFFSSCAAVFQGGTNVVLGTSFTAEDEDILGADEDYCGLEADLRDRIRDVERVHAGYEEYRYEVDEINHNPYELAAYLTVRFEDYTREEVQETLHQLFQEQYELTFSEATEIRTRTETRMETQTGTRPVWDAELGTYVEESYEYEEAVEYEVEYEYRILTVHLKNQGLGTVIEAAGLSADEMERYQILLETRGNRSYLFGGDIYAVPQNSHSDYRVPTDALTNERFANMIREGEKYLGMSYVWGGSNPETGFDCSGFVSWVINHSGNGWDVGRKTANGLLGVCDRVPQSEASPGDLVFFQGTYDTPGASHVAIYVGNGMMLNCGNPISYTSMESSYWRQHFYCVGRLP